MQVSLASTPHQSVRPYVHMLVILSEFPFCQLLWDLTKRRGDIAVADRVADMVADMEVHMVADMEVDKVADTVADKVADMVADRVADMVADI